MKQDTKKPFVDSLFEQMANISKAHAYDIVSKQRDELMEENRKLKDRVKYLENLIKESSQEIIENCNKISEIFKPTTNENHV